jgi:hypothetical protein
MKAICKTNITTNTIKFNLTIGKVYEVHRYSPVWVYIIDDGGAKEHYIENMFTPMSELRDLRLEEILK